ncbi:uncharacterized protein LOC128231999 [Mya arenaria]|uniref:uncharacterized protein LOC128231999 n=1 Tax=Mya arenaria TaxID=6604 RepID=UPI0022E0EAC5|nr:uncharacterized protein LOC128231999 [Mya arenaria]
MADEATKEAPSMAERVKNTLAWTGIPVAMPGYVKQHIDAGKPYKAVLKETKSPMLKKCEPNVESLYEADDPINTYDAGWAKGAAPFDSRFPHQNQLPNCERNYIDYQRCIRLKGEDYPNCNYFKASYLQLCPKKYVSEWDEQVEAGSYKYLPDNIPEH